MPLHLDLRDQSFSDQNRILSQHELPALECARRLDEAETASLLDSDVLANKETSVHR